MPVPEITHLQFLILHYLLLKGQSSGLSLRGELERKGVRKSGPAFYQLMTRMEEGGFVEGWYQTSRVNDQTIKERRYKVTGAGKNAWHDLRDFYQSLSVEGLPVPQ